MGYRDATRIDGGADDDFHLRADSPGVERADPLSYDLAEPAPNGGRANLGAYGNTAEAARSASELAQVLSPAGLEKFIVGQPVDIRWQTPGFGSERIAALINAGGETVQRWLFDHYRVSPGIAGVSDRAVNLSAVPNAAPVAVYQSYVEAQSGVGRNLTYELPVPDGTYAVKLHFIEPSDNGAGSRKFDILIQGAVAAANFDIVSLAGASAKALARSFYVTVTGGAGLRLQLVNRTELPAILSALEITAPLLAPSAGPAADVEISLNGGTNWTTVASGVSADRFGGGQFQWTPAQESAGNAALIRVTVIQGSRPQSVSAPFLITNAGHEYFVNDATVAPGDFTTASGNNTNSGKDAAHPMASLTALLAAYPLGAGDVVRIDAGQYPMTQNVVLESEQAGLRIEGFADAGAPSRRAVLNRGGTASGNYLFELRGAGGVMLANLNLTGARTAIVASASFASTALITGAEIYGNISNGVEASATGQGIELRSNRIHDNGGSGLVLREAASAVENVIFGHATAEAAGIRLADGAMAEGNVVYGNYDGIAVEGLTAVKGNRVLNNRRYGIQLGAGTSGEVTFNRIYDNPTGLAVTAREFHGWITNNLVYRNSTQGFLISGAKLERAEISNNTFQQTGSPAIVLENRSRAVTLRNNIFAVSGAPAIRVTADSQTDFASDYNLFFLTAGAKIGQWDVHHYARQADWFYELGFDQNSQEADARFVDPDGADNQPGYDRATGSDHGADDDFHLQAGSPAIDAGDPDSYYLAEPWPNGGRADLGAYGNSPEATPSASHLVQLLSPNGFEKWEVSQPHPVLWRSAGIRSTRVVAQINVGGGAVDGWLSDRYLLGTAQRFEFNETVDLAGANSPAPMPVYQTAAFASYGLGQKLVYHLPVPDGNYTVRLHFADHENTGAGQRLFDITLQSVVASPDFDIYAASGGQHKAVVTSHAVSATAGRGVLLELVNRTEQLATLSAIEILTSNPNPLSNVNTSLELSTDNGANWTPAAADLPMDVAGNGEFLWTPGQYLAGQTALLRLRVAAGALFSRSSNSPFLIVNGGRDYYVNDTAFAPNDWTTATGNNAYSGKDPAHPVASLFALFTAYDLDPNDVVHADTGRYTVPRNLVLGVDDSGVRIVGYHDELFPDRFSRLERGNTVEGSYLFELRDASDVTLDWLHLTGAETGIRVADDSASHGFTVRNSTIYGNQTDGIYLGYEAAGAVIANNSIFGIKGGPTNDDQVHGIVTHAANVQVNANTIFDHRNQGIWATGTNSVLQGNELYGNSIGILAEGP